MSENILNKIKEKRIIQLSQEKESFKTKSLFEALKKPGLQILGEIKRSSPSKGMIANDDFNLEDQVSHYVQNNIAGISILTENAFFKGQNEDLQFVHNKYPNIPILRKDFIFDPFQVFHAKELGASAILLIVKMLNDDELFYLHDLAYKIGLEVLVETHDEIELTRALQIPNLKLLGINNRNLNTFETDLNISKQLISIIPSDIRKNIVLVSESGYLSHAVLVGEALMKNKIYKK